MARRTSVVRLSWDRNWSQTQAGGVGDASNEEVEARVEVPNLSRVVGSATTLELFVLISLPNGHLLFAIELRRQNSTARINTILECHNIESLNGSYYL